MPKSVQKRLDEGRAVYDLGEERQDPDTAAEARGTPDPLGGPAPSDGPVPARFPQSMGFGPLDELGDPKPDELEE